MVKDGSSGGIFNFFVIWKILKTPIDLHDNSNNSKVKILYTLFWKIIKIIIIII